MSSPIKSAFHSFGLLFCLIVIASTSYAQAPAPAPTTKPIDIHARVTETVIDANVAGDPAVEKMLEAYAPKVRALNEVIGKLKGDLKKGGLGAGTMGNFVADALRSRAGAKLGKPVLLAITNSGGLRKTAIFEGDLTVGDIFELLPFENALIAVDLTGEQLRRFLGTVLRSRDAQSGARILFRLNEKKENEIVSAQLTAGGTASEIDPNATYTIVTTDYLIKRGGAYSILQEGKNHTPLNLTMRDAVLDYVKSETAAGRTITATLDGRFKSDKPETETDSQQ